MTDIDLTTLDDPTLAKLRRDVLAEVERRDNLAAIPDTMNRLTRTYLEAEGHQEGEEWFQPSGAHDSFPEGWTVTHDGKTWVSLIPGNVWQPGVSGWREVLPEGEVPEWVAPTGEHDAYQAGDRVTFDGQVFESTMDGNVWSPADYPAGWTQVE